MHPHWLVLGGTGFVGRAFCEAVARQRDTTVHLVVPTRQLARAAAIQHLPTVEPVQADLHDDATLDRLVAGCDAVVNLVAILHGNEAAFERVHVELPRRLAAACQRHGVQRLVHVSALGAAVDAPSRYLRSKARGEAVLQAAGLALTLLRPSVIFGAQDRFLNLFAALQRLAPVMPLAGAEARFQPVWVEDVASALLACLRRPDSIGQVYELGGPDVMTLADLVRLAGRLSGHPRPVWALPPALGRAQAALMACLPGEPLMSPDNLDSMTLPNVVGGWQPGLASLGIAPASVRAVAPLYLSPGQACARLDALRALHR